MLGERDLTLQVAARLALVLGYELVRTGEVLREPLAQPPASTRGRPEGSPPPETAHARGQGRRVDLEAARASHAARQGDAGEAGTAGAAGRRPASRRGAAGVEGKGPRAEPGPAGAGARRRRDRG
jgi:hypothetical protein